MYVLLVTIVLPGGALAVKRASPASTIVAWTVGMLLPAAGGAEADGYATVSGLGESFVFIDDTVMVGWNGFMFGLSSVSTLLKCDGDGQKSTGGAAVSRDSANPD